MAVICRAIDVIKDNKGITIGYVLSDTDGNVMQVPSDKIKAAIKAKQVVVSNLKLTSNNRLIQEDIEVSNKFKAVADKMTELSGVKHSKPCIEDFYFFTRFENIPAYLIGKIDDSEIILSIKDKNVDGQINANTISRASALIKKMYCDYITENTPVNNEIGTPKKEDVNNQYRIITINASEIHHNQEIIAENLGIDWDDKEECFRIVDESAIVVINSDCYTDVAFYNSKVHGFKVICNDGSRYGAILKYCEMQYLEVKDVNLQLVSCIVYNTANVDSGRLDCYQLTYVNFLKLINCKSIGLNCIIANKVYVEGKSMTLDASDVQYIKKLNVKATECIQIQGDKWTVEDMDLAAETVRFNVNQYRKNTDRLIQMELAELNGKYTYPNLYMIVCNHFTNADDVVANVNVIGNIRISALAWKCKFNEEIKVKASQEYDRVLNAEIIQDSIPNNMKISMGGIAITDNTDITFVDLKIAALYKSRSKNYSLGSSGIFLLDDSIKNFSITIANSIKPATKSSIYDLNLVIRELKKISKINPIKVLYDTQAYEILTTNGVEVDILNKDAISQSVKNTSVKEKIIGVTVMDTIEKAIGDSLSEDKDDTRYGINTGINVELPKEVIETYQLNIASGNNTDIPTKVKALLDVLSVFPANNLPFTTDVINRIKTNPKFRAKTELVASCENIMVNLISITYTDMIDIDQYIVVTNGSNLIYMTYIGNCEFTYNKGSSLKLQEGVQAVRKLDSVDLVLKSVSQSLTMASIKNTKQLLNDIDNLFNKSTLTMYNSKTSSIITVGASGNLVTFKVGGKKLKRSKFDANYERAYLSNIEKIEPNDVLGNIKTDVLDSYSNSVLLRTKDISDTSISEANSISSCKVSSLWQLAHKHVDSLNEDIISSALLDDILQLGFFNEITEKEFIQALKKSSKYYKRYNTDGSFDIETYNFNGKLKKLQGKYMGKISYLHVITYFDGSAEYYTADESIDNVLGYMKKITRWKNIEQFEKYVKDFNYLKESLGFKYTAADTLAYKINVTYKDIRYVSVPSERIYNAIKDAEQSCDFDKKLKLLRTIGMTEYEYTHLLNSGSYYREEDKHRNITSEVISKMPKSQELLDLLKIDESFFDNLVKLNKCDNITYELKHLAKDSVEIIYSSRVKLQSTQKGYSTRTHIGICKKTGYCYLFTVNGQYLIPALRIASFKEAMILRKQLMEEEAEVQKKCGLMQDLGWNHSDELVKTIELNLNNVSDMSEYPQQYKHLVAYISDEAVLEDIEGSDSTQSKTEELKSLREFSQSNLTQFIQMGAIQIVVNIPSSYKYSKTYNIDNSNYKAVEYYNKDNGLYAFEIGKDTKLLSEYSLDELFN